MKYCRHCGNQLQDEDLFCPKCGTRQEAVQEEIKPTPELEIKPEPAPMPEPIPEPVPEIKIEPAPREPVEPTPMASIPIEQRKPQSRWQRGRGETKLSAKDSIMFMAAYSVFYIVYSIISPMLPESMYFSRLLFIFLFGTHLAIMIVRMVKSINRKLRFLTVLHICFVGLSAAMVIGAFILLASAPV